MISNTPENLFKKSLQAGEIQIGVWSAMGNPVSAEICAGSGFDFVVIDAEHGPQHAESLIGQLQGGLSSMFELLSLIHSYDDDPFAGIYGLPCLFPRLRKFMYRQT